MCTALLVASSSADAAARSLLARRALLQSDQWQLRPSLPRSGRQTGSGGRFDPEFFETDSFGDFAREDLNARGGGFQGFDPTAERQTTNRRGDDAPEEELYYADPADLWQVGLTIQGYCHNL